MLIFVCEHLDPKKMCKNTFKRLPLVMRYVPGQFKT